MHSSSAGTAAWPAGGPAGRACSPSCPCIAKMGAGVKLLACVASSVCQAQVQHSP